MSAQPIPEGGTLRHVAAAEIRAELARQRKTSAQLARALKISPQAMSRRTTGELPLDVDELEAAAAFLGVPVAQLLGVATRPHEPTVAKVDRPLRAVPTPSVVTLRPHAPRPIMQLVPGL